MIRKGVLVNLIQLVQVAALVGITILVTRVTGAHGRGIYTLASSVAVLAATITGLGISWAGIYYISKNQFPLARVTSTLLTVSISTAAVAAIALAVVYLVFQQTYFHEVSPSQALLMLVLAAFVQVSTTTASILLGLNRPLDYAAITMLQVVVAFVIQVILAMTGSLTATAALAAFALGAAASAGYGLVLVAREAPVRLGLDRRILRSFFTFGIRGYAANLMTLLSYRLDGLIVNGLKGVTLLGYYSVATAMAETLTYGAVGFALVLFPQVSSVDKKEADRITPVVCRNAVFLTLAGAVIMFVASRELILLIFGPAMTPALVPLWLLLPGIVFMAAAKVISSYLSGIGKPIYTTYIAAGAVIVTVVLDLALIPPYGISGAAIASTITYTGTAIASVWLLKVESGAGWLEALVVRRDDFARYKRVASSTMKRLVAMSPARP
jgi:O-antigen/teichoic acid export membrane protein